MVEGEENTQLDQDIARKIVPNSRITEADKKNDSTSLERKLSRTLYLVVKQSESDGEWKFPNFKQPENGELVPLHELAETGLYSIGGRKLTISMFSCAMPCNSRFQRFSKQYFINLTYYLGHLKLKKRC